MTNKKSKNSKKTPKPKAKIMKKPLHDRPSRPAETRLASSSKNPSASVSTHKINPLGDRVLIKPFLENENVEKNDFGIIIPDTVSKESPEQGMVIAVGEGRIEDGKRIPMKVKVGDVVIFSKYGFDEVKFAGDELYILKEENILAILKK